MNFNKIASRDPARYQLLEEKERALYIEKKYLIGKTYLCDYQLQTNFPTSRELILDADNNFQFKEGNGKQLTIAKKKTTTNFSLIFSPQNLGVHKFMLFLSSKNVKSIDVVLLERKLVVLSDRIEIESAIQKNLPKIMKLGQKEKIVFYFENKSNQSLTGASIEIKDQ